METQSGHNLHRMSLDNPGLEETSNGVQLTITRIERWVHVDKLYEVKTRMTGVLSSLRSQMGGLPMRGGESRQIFIEREYGDFRRLPGTQMDHPFRTTSRIGGFLSDQEQEELKEYAGKLDDMERRMAAMPPDQRQKMQQMNG